MPCSNHWPIWLPDRATKMAGKTRDWDAPRHLLSGSRLSPLPDSQAVSVSVCRADALSSSRVAIRRANVEKTLQTDRRPVSAGPACCQPPAPGSLPAGASTVPPEKDLPVRVDTLMEGKHALSALLERGAASVHIDAGHAPPALAAAVPTPRACEASFARTPDLVAAARGTGVCAIEGATSRECLRNPRVTARIDRCPDCIRANAARPCLRVRGGPSRTACLRRTCRRQEA